jgi:uncharacterized protein YcgL (UPF0745 family)
MKCTVHPSSTHGVRECLILPVGKLLGDLPSDVLKRFRHAEVWKTIDLREFKRYAGLNAERALRDIQTQGYHVSSAGRDVVDEWPD